MVHSFLKSLILLGLWLSPQAQADCTNSENGVPGREGEIQYNTVSDQLEYCDFNNWRTLKLQETRSNLTTIYNQTFEGGVAADEWGTTLSESLTRFLGRLGGTNGAQGSQKIFPLSGTQSSTQIQFDLYVLDGWGGQSFRTFIDDTPLFSHSFNGFHSVPANGTTGNVSWTVQALNPIRMNMGFAGSTDLKLRYTLTITNPGSLSVKLGFGSTLIARTATASYGIDNLRIDEVVGGVPTTVLINDFEAGVPPDDWQAGGIIFNPTRFLGRLTSTGGAFPMTNRTITLPANMVRTQVTFDLYELGTVDNEPFSVYFDDQLVYTRNFVGSSYDMPTSGSAAGVSWTVTNLTSFAFDFGFGLDQDQAYRFVFTYENPGASSIKIGFGTMLNEPVASEAFGVDNIQVEAETTLGTSTVYQQDFEGVVDPNEFGSPVSFTFGSFLGRLGGSGGNQQVSRTIALPGTQESTLIEFDFYQLDSWDTENFRVFINDSAVITDTFNVLARNLPSGGTNGNVSWTVTPLVPFAAQFGSMLTAIFFDQPFRYRLTITNPGATSVKIGFGSTLNSPVTDESYGIDNVRVERVNGGEPTLVWEDNFNDGRGDLRWTGASNTEKTAITRVLGRRGGSSGLQALSRTYTLSGTQETTEIVLDILEIDTWDAENFHLFIDDNLVLTRNWTGTVFDLPGSGAGAGVTWSGVHLTQSHVNFGSDVAALDQAYRYTLVIPNPGATSIKIGFGSNTNETAANESYGIDNVLVREFVSGVPNQISYEDFESGATGWSDNTTYFEDGSTFTVTPTIFETGTAFESIYTVSESSTTNFTFARTRTESGGANFTTLLGRFPNTGRGQGPARNFTLPGTQDVTKIEFNFYEIDQWHSNENFVVYVNDEVVHLGSYRDIVYDKPRRGVVGNVNWRVNNLTYLPLANLGFSATYPDQIYRFTLRIANPGATQVKLGFGSWLEGTSRTFGIDNVRVETFNTTPLGSVGACAGQGQMRYDAGLESLVWCDGALQWHMTEPGVGGGGGCTSPTSAVGALNFNSVSKQFERCDGANWRAVDND